MGERGRYRLERSPGELQIPATVQGVLAARIDRLPAQEKDLLQTLAVIGAVVGEFVGADRGLGFLINVGRGQYDTALVFVAIFTLVAMALALYGLVVFIESRLLSWQQRPGEPR